MQKQQCIAENATQTQTNLQTYKYMHICITELHVLKTITTCKCGMVICSVTFVYLSVLFSSNV